MFTPKTIIIPEWMQHTIPLPTPGNITFSALPMPIHAPCFPHPISSFDLYKTAVTLYHRRFLSIYYNQIIEGVSDAES